MHAFEESLTDMRQFFTTYTLTQFLQHLDISKDLFLCLSHLLFHLHTQAEFYFTAYCDHNCMCMQR